MKKLAMDVNLGCVLETHQSQHINSFYYTVFCIGSAHQLTGF